LSVIGRSAKQGSESNGRASFNKVLALITLCVMLWRDI
jgi:hypothetical protein